MQSVALLIQEFKVDLKRSNFNTQAMALGDPFMH
jgi:hypothetical protein